MTVQLRQLRNPKRPRTGRGLQRTATAAQRQERPRRQPVETIAQRERDADGPEDRALYHCHCGFVFEAAVSTSVSCPHCGSAQAW